MQEYQYSAKYYDLLLSPWMRPIRNRIAAIVKKHGYCYILDVCCGTGEQLKILKEQGIEGKGVDLSEAMLAVAKKGPIAAECDLGDATEMVYADESFDLVMTTFALHEKSPESARRIIEEMLRLVQVGGDIIIVDYEINSRSSWFYKTMIFLIERIAGGEHYRNFKAFLSNGGLPDLLQNGNLRELRRYYFGGQSIALLHLRKMP